MACPFDRSDEQALMLGACSGNPFWNDSALFRHEPLQLLFRLVVDVVFLVVAKPAGALFSNLAGCTALR